MTTDLHTLDTLFLRWRYLVAKTLVCLMDGKNQLVRHFSEDPRCGSATLPYRLRCTRVVSLK